ncbi:MAG TPA: GreA/GreB family elongation factor [Planctomycetota bacterium]|nr:GreA/GreB family elongation factor [Planctomycetota bacterium]
MAAEAFRSRIGSALANRDFAEFEAAFREYASLHPEDHAYLAGAAGQLLRYDKGPLAGELLLSLAQTLLEKGDVDGAFETARAALRASQRPEGLREVLLAVYKAKHGTNPNLETFLAKSGLAGEGAVRPQIEALDRYLTFAEGAYVFHRGGWGYGVVAEFDPEAERMVVDFQRKPGHQIGIQSATKILERLPDDHIGVFKHYRQEELKQLMDADPAKVFRIFLRSHGGKTTLKQVREAFVPDVLDKNEWSRWWTRAKKEILKDPQIKVGKGSTPAVELREKALTVEDEVVERMQARASVGEKVGAAREFLRSLDLTPSLATAIGTVADRVLAGTTDPADRIALLYLKSDLKGEGAAAAEQEAKRILLDATDVVAFFHELDPADRKRAAGDLVESGAPDATDRVVSVLRAGDVEAADAILDHLKKHRPDVLITFFGQLSANPRENPELFLWYARGFLNGTIPVDLAPGEKETTAVEKLLTLADQAGLEVKRTGDARLKEFLRHVRSFFTSRRLKMFEELVERTSPDYGRYLFAKIQRNRGFTDQTRQALQDVIEAQHPNIRTAPAEATEAAAETSDVAADAGFIYTTLHGYRRRERELKEIREVEVPKNAEDLGRAAAFGDISENAEYSAALERQEHLMRRMKELKDDLDKARILDPGQVTTDKVVVGTRVRLQNLTSGGEETYALLGPWDTDLERGVISYLSPVGRGLLGKGRGAKAEIVLPEGAVAYEIMDIEAAPPDLLQAEQ